MFSQEDFRQIRHRGSDPEVIRHQLARFKKGFPFTEIVEPATLSASIAAFSSGEKEVLADWYDAHAGDYDVCRFVPASGAATRMFKSLYALKEKLAGMSADEQRAFVEEDPEARQLFASPEDFPFYRDLSQEHMDTPLALLQQILDEQGLNYGMLPKGLLKFHRYGDVSRTAFEEHLHEAARMHEKGADVALHFTVSEEHLEGFRQLEQGVVPGLEKEYGITFRISYTFQKPETDTIAVDMDNRPFRDEAGRLVFRPGGHGALLDNLDDLSHDILFINNIDNISPDRNSAIRVLHKKMLGGFLMQTLEKVRGMISGLKRSPGEAGIAEALDWLKTKAFVQVPEELQAWPVGQQSEWIIEKLERPLRVCGMVKNEGEPGGGPFFTRDSRGVVSLQIVEKSQVDVSDPAQSALFSRSSHFNPVDLVCSLKDSEGRSFALNQFVDPETGFISGKSIRGRDLKALELPGLWNGSMAGWLTLFVEIPAETFTPVKTVFDLVRPQHKSQA